MKQNSMWKLKKMKNKRDPIDIAAEVFMLICIAAIIYLKIIGTIKLSWFWIFSPIIGLFGLSVVFALILGIICIVTILIDKGDNKNERY